VNRHQQDQQFNDNKKNVQRQAEAGPSGNSCSEQSAASKSNRMRLFGF